jgi:hypothetical protein
MADLRVWQLPFTSSYPLYLAADARLGSTEARADAMWEVHPGVGESALFALHTRYGGRAGLVSLVPMWVMDDGVIYQAAQVAGPTTLRAFAPGFAQLQTKLTPQVALLAEFWVMESRAVGGRFTLRNGGKQPVTLRLDMLGFVGMDGREMPTKVIFIPGERHALSLGVIRDLTPVLMLEGGFAAADSGGNKISASLSLAPGAKASLRFVCAAQEDARSALGLAKRWLLTDWGPHFKKFSAASSAIPRVETGDADLDSRIALAYTGLVQSFVHAPERAAQPIMVAQRGSVKASRAPLSAHVVYMNALAMAGIDPTLAHGLLRNLLATQREDGWIDAAPPIGDRPTVLHVPLLARLAWSLFQYSEDSAFLKEVYPGLRRFFARWLAPDLDADGDGAPEWQSTAQMGMMTRLALASIRVNARRVETPGLLAHLLSEALSLRELAHFLRDETAEAEYAAQVERLRGLLETFWQADKGHYSYRDRDTHLAPPAQTLLSDGEGDADHLPVIDVSPHARVVVLVEGGFEHTPKFTLTVQGIGRDGGEIVETAESEIFEWETGRGYYTTEAVFARLDRVRCDGLVRVYKMSAFTSDLTMEDADSLLPLWSAGIAPERALALRERIASAYLTPRGIAAEPVITEESARVYPALNTLLGEGLLEYGDALAGEVVRRQFAAPTTVPPMAETLPPLHLLLRVLGVRVISKTKVWTGGAFPWGRPIKLTHKGVTVERSAQGTRITFASKQVVELPPDAPWQEVVDRPATRNLTKKSLTPPES